MLYLRVKEVAQRCCGSDSRLASLLNIKQNTFSQYLNEQRQDKLWPHLEKILELFPDVNRYWLYHGEGEITKNIPTAINEVQQENKMLQKKLAAVEEKLEEERTINKKLINRLLLEGSPQVDSDEQSTSKRKIGQK